MAWKRFYLLLPLVVFSLFLSDVSAVSPAGEAILFEKTFFVPRSPVAAGPQIKVVQETFEFPAGSGREGLLAIRKRATAYPVLEGTVRLNGRRIDLNARNLNDNVIQKMPVVLEGENRLDVYFVCHGGVSLTFTISQNDISIPAASLALSEETIHKGGSAVLSWETECCEQVVIEPGIGAVSPSGSLTVSPVSSTTYVLTGTGPRGIAGATTRLAVTGMPASLPEGSFGKAYEDLIPEDATIDSYDPRRFAIVTGLVRDLSGEPLEAVRVTVFDHSEYGTALTGPEGRFSLPVEGGGALTVVYAKEGFLEYQRQVTVPWNDIAVVDAVRMLVRDSKATPVIFDGKGETVITHRSSEISDASGSRSCTVVFTGDNPPVLLDESGNPLRAMTNVAVRATEYPVPESMPAVLPPASAFTYCVDMEVDGVRRLSFDRPVVTWVDNFLGFPAGMAVPVGYYDRDRAAWVPSENGVVVALLDTNGDGIVDALDATGDGLPDDLDGDGSFSDETAGLEDPGVYLPGATCWRVAVSHFSPWDCNWPSGPPPDAVPPNPEGEPSLDGQKDEGEDCETAGIASTVNHRSRILHEDIVFPGTAFTLHYTSDRVKGYKTPKISVPVSGETVPESLRKIMVSLHIAGQYIKKELDPLPNQVVEFYWDGLDYLGRPVAGGAMGTVRIGFVYDKMYYYPSAYEPAFGLAGSVSTKVFSRESEIFWESEEIWIPKTGAPASLAEGWTLACHHALEMSNNAVLYKGSGLETRNGGIDVVDTFAGDGTACYSGDEKPAVETGLNCPEAVVIDASGNLFIADTSNHRVRKVDSAGIITTVAGNGEKGFSGDGGPAVEARLMSPKALAADGSGNLYIADCGNNRIRRIDSRGGITTVAGKGEEGFSGDGGPAVDACLCSPESIALDGSDNLYIADRGNDRIRRVDTRGFISTVVEMDSLNYIGNDGRRATSVPAEESLAIAADKSGNLYISYGRFSRIYRVDARGNTTIMAGNGKQGFEGDGGPAIDAGICGPKGLAVDDIGNLYVADQCNNRIRRIDPEGMITTVAGDGAGGHRGDGRPAKKASLWSPGGVAVEGSGTIYIADTGNQRVRKVNSLSFLVPWGDDRLLHPDTNGLGYVMDRTGRHLMTIDLETKGTIHAFGYDGNNRLSQITDRFGSVTAIQRNGDGIPTGIVSPDGIVTSLAIDDKNHLNAVTGPDGSAYTFEYTPGGLLTAKVEPEGNRFEHVYDGDGRLTAALDEEGGSWRFSRTVRSDGDIVSEMTTGEGDVTAYRDRTAFTGAYASLITGPSGATTAYFRSDDGLDVTKSLSCGMDLTFRYDLDPRYRFKYIRETTRKTPSSLERTTETAKTREDTNDDGEPDRITETTAVNGRSFTRTTDTLAFTRTFTTPEGRTITAGYDPETLVTTRIGLAGFADWTYGYDAKGRLVSLEEGKREATFTYDGRGNLSSRTDPENGTTRYTHDAPGRVTNIFRPDGSTIGFTYDRNGNLTALENPAHVIHRFLYNGVNRNRAYETPISGSYNYSYDKDRRLTGIRFPSGKEIRGVYSKGNLIRIETPEGNTDVGYNACGTKVNALSRGGEGLVYTHDGILTTSETLNGTVNQSLLYGYDNDFRLKTLAYAGGTVTYAYDGDGLLTGAGNFTLTRNEENGLPGTVSDGIRELSRVFNGYGEVERETLSVNRKAVSDVAYTRDRAGRITGKTETVDGTTRRYNYAYDDLGRLVSASRDGTVVETYGYNATGTRIHDGNRLRGISGRTMVYSEEEHLLQAGKATCLYDLDGFLLRKTDPSGDRDYYYTTRGELEKVVFPDGKTIEYLYDPLGRRIAKKVNGAVTEKYLWQGQTRLLAVYDGGDRLLQRFDYAGGRMPEAVTADGSTWYFVFDPVGTLRIVTDAEGNIVKRLDYDAFGNLVEDTNPAFPVPFGFAGGLYDKDTTLVRFGFRDYDPDTGRWTAKDPIGFAGGDTDLYGYCLNNPIEYFDPEGLFHIGKRPLEGYPWLPGPSSNPLDDYLNAEFSHEHGFFDDGSGENIGFGENGRFSEDPIGKGYRYDNEVYDDDIIRRALENIEDGKYSNWPWNKNNCQDWIERLIEEYWRILDEGPCN